MSKAEGESYLLEIEASQANELDQEQQELSEMDSLLDLMALDENLRMKSEMKTLSDYESPNRGQEERGPSLTTLLRLTLSNGLSNAIDALQRAGADQFTILHFIVLLPLMVQIKAQRDQERQQQAKMEGHIRMIKAQGSGLFARMPAKSSGPQANVRVVVCVCVCVCVFIPLSMIKTNMAALVTSITFN